MTSRTMRATTVSRSSIPSIHLALLLVGILCVRFEIPSGALATTNTGGDDNDNDDFVCGVYVAPSTLPGTGLGMYAGARGFRNGETITKTLGDHVVAIPDSKETHGDTSLYDRGSDDMSRYFLWDQYTWNPNAFGIGIRHIATRDNEIASPGFGAAANSFMDFVNVEEGGCAFGLLESSSEGNGNIHRSKDPGAGAFTQFHSRQAWARKDIEPFGEFFVSYGDEWFLDRQWRLGVIPVTGDHQAVEDLWKTYHNRLFVENGRDNEEKHSVFREFWKTFVANGKDVWPESRIFSAMPGDEDDDVYDKILESPEPEGSYVSAKQSKMKRTAAWLDEHGICADSVEIGRSTIPQAGHGAFAKTGFAEGEAIMAAPLIHIPDRAVLDTYFQHDKMRDRVAEEEYDEEHAPYLYDDEEEEEEEEAFDEANDRLLEKYHYPIGYAKTGSQLLLNYVFGHRDSTLALSPYGPGVQLINHNQTLSNVKLEWAQSHRSNHDAKVLEESVDHIRQTYQLGSVLGMEIVATRPIRAGDELFLDYGDEWESAWRHHVETWRPTEGSDSYLSAVDLNTLPELLREPLPNTRHGELFRERDPRTGKRRIGAFPFNTTTRLLMNAAWRNYTLRDEGEDKITDEIMWEDYDYDPVEVIYKTGTKSNPYKYEYEDKEIYDSLDDDERDEVLAGYRKFEAQIEKKKQKKRTARGDAIDEAEDEDEEDPTLYTVIVRRRIDEHDPETLREYADRPMPTFERLTVEEVPRRGLKFEDLSYTHDQFLPNAFREYIRIPDAIFPEAWKNLKTPLAKKRHYWRFRDPSDPASRGSDRDIRAGFGYGERQRRDDPDDDMFADDSDSDRRDGHDLDLDLDDVEFFFGDKYLPHDEEQERAMEEEEEDEEDREAEFAAPEDGEEHEDEDDRHGNHWERGDRIRRRFAPFREDEPTLPVA